MFSEETLALCIDFQEKLFPHIADHDNLKSNLAKLVSGLNVLQVPIVLSEQYKKGLGETLPEITDVLDPVFSIEKIAFSCVDHPNFMTQLQSLNKEVVLIFGIEAHICVMQTAIDLKAEGLTPVVVVDCIESRNVLNKEVALERMKQEGILLTTYEAILFELCRKAGTNQFKAISKIVKYD